MIKIVSENIVENPLVSVVIPNYNRADVVGQAIDSILLQKCNFNFEIIIGDDCSTDNAKELLIEYQKNNPKIIKLLLNEKNIGLGANWAICVKECRGIYICNCDNDDYWHNVNKLQLQVDYMQKHYDCGIVITNHRTHNRNTGEIKECKAFIDRDMPLQQAVFRGRTSFCNATIMYRKSLIDEYLNLNDYIKYQFTLQDWNTWMILSAYSDICILNESTATFGIETESITRPKSYESIIKRFVKEEECYKYICDMFPQTCPFNKSVWDSYVNNLLFNLAYNKCDFDQAKKYGENIHSLKGFCSRYRVLFYLFRFCKKLK